MDKRGFTLLEVLVALVILSISFMSLIYATNQGVDMAQHARFVTTASLLAQEHMGKTVAAHTPVAPGEARGDFGEDFEGYTYVERKEATPLAGYFKYVLTINWGGEDSGFETSFTTFLSVL